AGVDGHGLVGVVADQVAVADVVGPGGAAVGLAGEGVALAGGVRGPRAGQAAGGEGAEVASLGPLGLDDHQVLALSGDLVDLDRLEQVGRRVAHDRRVVRAEAAGEVPDRHGSPIDVAV